MSSVPGYATRRSVSPREIAWGGVPLEILPGGIILDGTNGIDGDVLPVRIVDVLQDSLRVDHQTSDFGFTAFHIQLIPAGEA